MRIPSLLLILACCLPLAATGSARADEPAPADKVDPDHARKFAESLDLFKSSVKKILVDRCASCHGVDALEGDFDITSREDLLKGTPEGKVLDLKDVAGSRLWKLVSRKEQPFMPYDEDPLPEKELELLRRWLELGAAYDQPLTDKKAEAVAWQERKVAPETRDFWSFRKLHVVDAPHIDGDDWSRTDVDRFVLRALREKGLAPNPLADRRTLIRRVYYDLLGLPPTADEVESFVNDPDPQAYEKLIDRLLASEHFGERWARHWLDVARFAESHGFEQDYDRPYAYHFRDFVIQAFNQDMPFDQFVRWQLAGDEFDPDNPQALMATGFLGAGVFPTQITANEVERTRYDALDDMAATTGNAFLGLSVGCARCHDHKFDPIPQADYYRFVSTFTTTVRSNIDVDMTPDDTARRLVAWEREHQPKVEALAAFEKDHLDAEFVRWLDAEEQLAGTWRKSTAWILLDRAQAVSKNGATLTVHNDGTIFASDKNPDTDLYTITTPSLSGLSSPKTLRLEVFPDPAFPKHGPGRADNGNFALSRIRVYVEKLDGSDRRELKLVNPRADFQQNDGSLSIASSLDDDPKTGWAVDPEFGKPHTAYFDVDPSTPLEPASDERLVFEMSFEVNTKHTIGKFRLSASTPYLDRDGAAEARNLSLVRALNEIEGHGSAALLEPETKSILRGYFQSRHPEWKKLHDAVEQSLAAKPQPNLVKMMVASEGVTPIRHHTQGADFFEQTFFLKRGDCDQKDGEAKPAFLQVLIPEGKTSDDWRETPPEGGSTSYRRRSLANWITDTEHGPGHLLARVIVNRLWQHHFGRGIVATPNDFGTQGERPTHPELLDALAAELIRNGWKLKPIHKLLLTSAAWMQTSERSPESEKVDPENRFCWRFSPRRVEAEIIRDSMLAVSGRLDATMFGPGTLDENHTRRSIYFMVKRSQLIPMMQIFDSPEPLVSVGDRPATTIAPQALLFLNGPQVRLSAESFARRLLTDDAPLEEIVRRGYLSTLGRAPNERELSLTVAFLQTQAASYAGANQPRPRELAVTDFCHSLFGLNEFIFVE